MEVSIRIEAIKTQLCGSGGFYRPSREKSRLVTVTGRVTPRKYRRDVLRLQGRYKAQGAPAKDEMSGGARAGPLHAVGRITLSP